MPKLAVKKERGEILGSGYHYMTHPIPMRHDREAELYTRMGYHIIEVDEPLAERLIESALAALKHQIEIACLVEKQNPEQ